MFYAFFQFLVACALSLVSAACSRQAVHMYLAEIPTSCIPNPKWMLSQKRSTQPADRNNSNATVNPNRKKASVLLDELAEYTRQARDFYYAWRDVYRAKIERNKHVTLCAIAGWLTGWGAVFIVIDNIGVLILSLTFGVGGSLLLMKLLDDAHLRREEEAMNKNYTTHLDLGVDIANFVETHNCLEGELYEKHAAYFRLV